MIVAMLLLGTTLGRAQATGEVGGGRQGLLSTSTPLLMTLEWSTYLGGRTAARVRTARPRSPKNPLDTAYDVDAGADGSVYVIGQTDSADFPTTVPVPHAGDTDVFVAKFSPDGTLQWSRLIGGPNHDVGLGIEVHPDGSEIVICGWAGPDLPTQACAGCGTELVEATFQGATNAGAAYGPLDGFVGKLDGNGNIRWLSYFGTEASDRVRDCDIDSSGTVYVGHSSKGLRKLGTQGAYRETGYGGEGTDIVIAKIHPEGRRVIWATYLGGTGNDHTPSVRVHSDGSVYVVTTTESHDWPLVNPVDRSIDGPRDFAIARVSSDGASLLFSSFLGGNGGNEFAGTHDLGIDTAGNLYLCAATDSTDFPGVAGSFQERYAGGVSDGIIAKVKVTAPTSILAATYVGGADRDGPHSGCFVDAAGNVLVGSSPLSTNYPTTAGAFQRVNDGAADAAVVQLSADLKQLRYGSYIGGSGEDQARAAVVDGASFVIAGRTRSTDLDVRNAFQSRHAEDPPRYLDAFVSKFSLSAETATPVTIATDIAGLTPTPTPPPTVRNTAPPTGSETRTPTTATTTPVTTPRRGDLDGDGRLSSDDLLALIAALFVPAPAEASDVTGDGRTTAADLPALVELLSAG